MFSEVFIIIVSWFSIIETCVRMIPPDEYYPTATLPDSPAVRKPVLVQPVMSGGSISGAGGSPAATVPATDAPVTSPGTVPTVTPGPVSLCTNCDINTIVPTSMATGTSYQVTELAASGSCKQTQVTCKRDDNQLCSNIQLTSVTPTGNTVVASATGSVGQVSGIIDCQVDGTYSSGTSTKISQLICVFDGCVPACTTCDINALLVTSNLLISTVTRMATSADANGCSRYTIQCARPGAALCSTKLVQAVTPNTGSYVVTDGGTENTAFTTMICANDRTWSYIGNGLSVTEINQVVCSMSCVP